MIALKKDSMSHLSETNVTVLDLLTGNVVSSADTEGIMFGIFPMENGIIGIQKEELCQIDLTSGNIAPLAHIPPKFFHVYPVFPLVLESGIIIPSTPAVCLSKSDFSQLWNLDGLSSFVEDSTPASLAGNESLVYFVLEKKGELYIAAINPQKGLLIWRSHILPAALYLTATEDGVFCGGFNLWKFSREGEMVWEVSLEQRIVSNMVRGPDGLYCVDAGNNLYEVDFEGNLLWKAFCEVSPWYYETHLLGGGDILYCVRNSGDVVSPETTVITAFNMKTGEKLCELGLGASHYVKAPPILADGILVVGTVGGNIIAVASDPDLFVKQGDKFMDIGDRNRASESYEKALELCEKKQLADKHQEILKHVMEQGFTQFGTPIPSPPQTQPPQPTPPETVLETAAPSTEPESSLQLPEWYYLLAAAGIITALVVYVLRRRK
ncbi:MAG: PQQ-binding-like beta-propeller repeat protein [Candidatus Methanofastidiosia archaeon]